LTPHTKKRLTFRYYIVRNYPFGCGSGDGFMAKYTTFTSFESFEGTTNGESTINLVNKAKKIVITNDSQSRDMAYRFNAGNNPATLKAGESISWTFQTMTIIIDGDNVDYRIWAVS